MPTVRTFDTKHKVPGFVTMTGLAVFTAGGEVNAGPSVMMGLEIVRTGLGLYSLSFKDGMTPGITVPLLIQVTAMVADPHIAIQLVDVAQILPGSTGFDFAYRDVDGVLTEPLSGSGVVYSIMRGNSAVEYR